MDKAAQRALEKYPKRKDGRTRGYVCDDNDVRRIYSMGYRKAENDLADAFQSEYAKELARADLALTWDDIQAIDNIIVDLAQHTDWPLRGQEVFYEEVLRRFREMKDK